MVHSALINASVCRILGSFNCSTSSVHCPTSTKLNIVGNYFERKGGHLDRSGRVTVSPKMRVCLPQTRMRILISHPDESCQKTEVFQRRLWRGRWHPASAYRGESLGLGVRSGGGGSTPGRSKHYLTSSHGSILDRMRFIMKEVALFNSSIKVSLNQNKSWKTCRPLRSFAKSSRIPTPSSCYQEFTMDSLYALDWRLVLMVYTW